MVKTINETFSEEEYAALKEQKEIHGKTWHDFILLKCTGSIHWPKKEEKT